MMLRKLSLFLVALLFAGTTLYADVCGGTRDPFWISCAMLYGGTTAVAWTTTTTHDRNQDRKTAELRQFLQFNYARLQVAFARGSGPYLAALGDLLGCDAVAAPRLGRAVQGAYSRLAFEQPQPARLQTELIAVLRRRPVLAAHCAAARSA
jgi:Protein of unknown function (DUF3015)